MQTIMIPDELLNKLEELCREGGYASIDTWLEEAVESQFTSRRRKKADKIAGRIRKEFHDRGHTEEEIPKDFETFREGKEERKQRAMAIAGRFRSGLGDLSQRHDMYFTEALGS